MMRGDHSERASSWVVISECFVRRSNDSIDTGFHHPPSGLRFPVNDLEQMSIESPSEVSRDWFVDCPPPPQHHLPACMSGQRTGTVTASTVDKSARYSEPARAKV